MDSNEILRLIHDFPQEFSLGFDEALSSLGMTYGGDASGDRSAAYGLGRTLGEVYLTRLVSVVDLDSTHVLVGESGGLSAVYATYSSYAMPGCTAIETEHGTLYMDSEEKVEVYAE